jgi:hypothetical protein
MDTTGELTSGILPQKETPTQEKNTLQLMEAKILKTAAQAYTHAQQLNTDLIIPHDNILEVFSLTREFFGASQEVTDYLFKESHRFANELSKVDGFVGAFGLGYPFYAVTKDGKPFEITEISNFIDYTRELIKEDSRNHPEGWICAACQANNNLPDLKTQCKPCDLVTLKPRDIFKGLPDLDMAVIIDNPNNDTETHVEKIANELGYSQSDTDIGNAIMHTKAALNEIKEGQNPQHHLPIDIHIWPKEAVRQCMELVAEGKPKVEIIGKALHSKWEDHSINFSFDFTFSLTELNVKDTSFLQEIMDTRHKMKEKIGIPKIIENVTDASARASRLMQTESIRNVLTERLKNW